MQGYEPNERKNVGSCAFGVEQCTGDEGVRTNLAMIEGGLVETPSMNAVVRASSAAELRANCAHGSGSEDVTQMSLRKKKEGHFCFIPKMTECVSAG